MGDSRLQTKHVMKSVEALLLDGTTGLDTDGGEQEERLGQSSTVKYSSASTNAGEQVECAGSCKSSSYRASADSDLSEESSCSRLSIGVNKPHRANDPRWKAIQSVLFRDGDLGPGHFRLLKRLGSGDIGCVYLSELIGTRSHFAMKLMDKKSLACRNKLLRTRAEREILQLLDHPFLPTLYTHFETYRYSCLVMEFCPGGDLHKLRRKQPREHFPEHYVNFYGNRRSWTEILKSSPFRLGTRRFKNRFEAKTFLYDFVMQLEVRI